VFLLLYKSVTTRHSVNTLTLLKQFVVRIHLSKQCFYIGSAQYKVKVVICEIEMRFSNGSSTRKDVFYVIWSV
jgi:hypothetical protein